MQQIFNIDSRFMRLLAKVMDLLILDLLWVISSLPIVTIGAATTALHYSCFKIIKDEEGPILQTFFKSFKSNFKHATIIWLILLGALAFLAFDFAASTQLSDARIISGSIFFGIFTLLAVIWGLLAIYVFALLARFSNSVKRTLVNAFVLGISHLGRSILMVILDVVLVCLGLFYLPVAVPVLPVLVNCFFLQELFAKHLPTDETVDCVER